MEASFITTLKAVFVTAVAWERVIAVILDKTLFPFLNPSFPYWMQFFPYFASLPIPKHTKVIASDIALLIAHWVQLKLPLINTWFTGVAGGQ